MSLGVEKCPKHLGSWDLWGCVCVPDAWVLGEGGGLGVSCVSVLDTWVPCACVLDTWIQCVCVYWRLRVLLKHPPPAPTPCVAGKMLPSLASFSLSFSGHL